MASISPDISSRLKPEVIQVVKIIYEEMCNLQPDQNVLIISDAYRVEGALPSCK